MTLNTECKTFFFLIHYNNGNYQKGLKEYPPAIQRISSQKWNGTYEPLHCDNTGISFLLMLLFQTLLKPTSWSDYCTLLINIKPEVIIKLKYLYPFTFQYHRYY